MRLYPGIRVGCFFCRRVFFNRAFRMVLILSGYTLKKSQETTYLDHLDIWVWYVYDTRRTFIYIYIYGHFPKRYSKQKRINVTFECRWHVLHFLLVAGPQLNAVVLQGSARFAQGSRKVLIVQLGRCQKPESRWFWQTRGKNRAQASRKLMRKLGLPEPPRAHAQPHVLFDSQHYSSLSYSFLSSYFSFLFFTFLRQFNLMYLCTSSSKAHRASDVDWFWDIRRTAYHCVLMRHVHQKCIE